jgi:hypothetical protein
MDLLLVMLQERRQAGATAKTAGNRGGESHGIPKLSQKYSSRYTTRRMADTAGQERSNSRSSVSSERMSAASACRIASASARLLCCSSATFSSTVSRAIRRYANT